MARYRAAWRRGRPPLGSHVSGSEATRLLQVLFSEGFRKADIAILLGHQYHQHKLNWPTELVCRRRFRLVSVQRRTLEGVTLRTVLRLRVIHRRACS
jgi:hypothetical protein